MASCDLTCPTLWAGGQVDYRPWKDRHLVLTTFHDLQGNSARSKKGIGNACYAMLRSDRQVGKTRDSPQCSSF